MFDSATTIASAEVRALFEGHEVACHTASHPNLTMIPDELVVKEIMDDRYALEALVGYPVRGFAWPFGCGDARTIDIISRLGIVYARNVEPANGYNLPQDWYRWAPTCHHNKNLLERTRDFLSQDWHRMLYVWGHSSEFDGDNNWGLLDEFGALLRGRDDIWYATNIEIYDYARACRRLICSADGAILENPSAVSVWCSCKGRPMEIAPGARVVVDDKY